MISESELQLLQEGTGRKVRTLQLTTLIAGVPTVVEMQVIAISDPSGNLVRLATEATEELLIETKRVRGLLHLIASEWLDQPIQLEELDISEGDMP